MFSVCDDYDEDMMNKMHSISNTLSVNNSNTSKNTTQTNQPNNTDSINSNSYDISGVIKSVCEITCIFGDSVGSFLSLQVVGDQHCVLGGVGDSTIQLWSLTG